MPKEIDNLIEGYKKFRQKNSNSNFLDLAINGQKPKALVIACSDSRVDPALVTNCQSGDLFVVRNVANLVPPYENDGAYHGTSAALEFAVNGLEVRHIIILGHSKCGGIQHLIQNDVTTKSESFIGKWMELANASKIAIEKESPSLTNEEKVDLCSQKSIVNSIRNLGTFPWVEERVKSGNLFLHGWFFDLEKCSMKFLNSETGKFEEIEE